jgi:hypothetical protein
MHSPDDEHRVIGKERVSGGMQRVCIEKRREWR